MPKVTIWIRDQDVDAWRAIRDKPEWLHATLNNQITPIASVIRLIKESGALETDATLRQFVDYCESISKIEGDKQGRSIRSAALGAMPKMIDEMPPVITGQDWYNRFKQEIGIPEMRFWKSILKNEGPSGIYTYCVDAARRAAGIEETS